MDLHYVATLRSMMELQCPNLDGNDVIVVDNATGHKTAVCDDQEYGCLPALRPYTRKLGSKKTKATKLLLSQAATSFLADSHIENISNKKIREPRCRWENGGVNQPLRYQRRPQSPSPFDSLSDMYVLIGIDDSNQVTNTAPILDEDLERQFNRSPPSKKLSSSTESIISTLDHVKINSRFSPTSTTTNGPGGGISHDRVPRKPIRPE